ncbi:MAG: hypothetical protein ACI9W2_001943 [Gammaproteobacteria bacterium]|jgi:hypothetical protein
MSVQVPSSLAPRIRPIGPARQRELVGFTVR